MSLDPSSPTPRPSPPLARQGGSATTPQCRAARPTFEALTGEIIWRTYPGHKWLTIEEAEAVLALVAEEWTRTRMAGGGPCGAISMAEDLTKAIKAARDWRKAAAS